MNYNSLINVIKQPQNFELKQQVVISKYHDHEMVAQLLCRMTIPSGGNLFLVLGDYMDLEKV